MGKILFSLKIYELVRSNKEFEEIVDEVILTEKDLLLIRQSIPKGKDR